MSKHTSLRTHTFSSGYKKSPSDMSLWLDFFFTLSIVNIFL